MKKWFSLIFGVAISIILTGCNDTIDDPETTRKDVEENNYNEVNEMKMDEEMDEYLPDLVDEDSLNDDGKNGNHPFDINEDGKLNIQKD